METARREKMLTARNEVFVEFFFSFVDAKLRGKYGNNLITLNLDYMLLTFFIMTAIYQQKIFL